MSTDKIGSLLSRLSHAEDSFTERKLEGVASEEIARTVIAFANSVPPNQSGVLFIGIADQGALVGVSNSDSLQKSIRQICENRCFPKVETACVVLQVPGVSGIVQIVAVEVPYSARGPHFMGPAFLRVGSETVRVTAEQYEDMFNRRCGKARQLLEWKNQNITVMVRGKKLGDTKRVGPDYHARYECRITDCTPHYATFDLLGYGRERCSEPLENITISWDQERYRPMLVVQEPK